MNSGSHTTPPRACGGDVAAYALGALDTAEVQPFLRHLNTCSVCRDELETFQQVVNGLAMTAPPYRAPTRLRRQVLRAVTQRPVAWTSMLRPPRRPGWARAQPALALGAALALAAAVLLGIDLSSPTLGGGARVIHAHVTGSGTAELRIIRGRGELIVNRFSPPPAGEIYEVWLVRGHRAPAPTSALFGVNAAGDGDVEVPGGLQGVTRIMVTPEPSSGSQVPTHPAAINASLT